MKLPPADAAMASNIYDEICGQIFCDARANDFSGYDPFDGLNSIFFEWAPALRKGLLGLAWIQLHKRSPINLRPFCGIPKRRNPKGVALFILGMLEQWKRNGDLQLLTICRELANWLLTQQSDKVQWHHCCWGYHFDWNARAFFVPKGKPNVITTVYVAQALYALSQVVEAAEQQTYRTAAFDAAHFIVKTLYTKSEDSEFFAYIPGETALVHNASLWGAAWVALVASQTANQQYAELALRIARQSVKAQAADGSWVYGSRHHHQFIDGFHTGYNLEALHWIKTALSVAEFDGAISKGMGFYKSQCFESDGTAKYYHNSRFPLDIHSVAQAIFTFCRVGATPEYYNFSKKVLDWAIDNMYMPERGQFYYQMHRSYVNKINYIRWTQGWAYYCISYLLLVQEDRI